ncbi:MAG: GNAT family N-acetyltransferase [Elusimicrobiota bacterium]
MDNFPELKWVAHGSPEWAALVELRREVLRRPLGQDFTPGQLAAESEQRHLGLWLNARPAGCLMLKDCQDRVAQMRQVAVMEGFRGKGFGRMMALKAEMLAKSRSFNRVILHSRAEAIGFYERLGYRIEGEPFIEIGIPHRLMAKNI